MRGTGLPIQAYSGFDACVCGSLTLGRGLSMTTCSLIVRLQPSFGSQTRSRLPEWLRRSWCSRYSGTDCRRSQPGPRLRSGDGLLLQEMLGHHQQAGGAVAALDGAIVDEALLQWVQLLAVGHSFHGFDGLAFGRHRQYQARGHRPAIHASRCRRHSLPFRNPSWYRSAVACLAARLPAIRPVQLARA